MPIPTWAWIAAGGSLLFMASSLRSDSDTTGIGDSEIDALAKMLIVEHFGGSDAERAQIVWVAINRAKTWGVSPAAVVEPGTRTPVKGFTAGTWNGDEKYRAAYEKAGSNKNIRKAREFVKRVLSGEFPNRGFTKFIHPAGMPSTPCAANRVLTDTFTGPRCMPQWAKNPTRVGAAYFYA